MTVKENGKINEIIPFNVGFRRIEITPIEQKAANGKPYVCLFINGQPLKPVSYTHLTSRMVTRLLP